MKKILTMFISALSLFSTIHTASALEYNAVCGSHGGKMSLSIYSSNDRMYVRYMNALGAADFPLYEGVVTKLSLGVIKIAQEDLASLDQQVLISWPLKNCEFNSEDPLIMECGGEAIFHYPQNTNLTSYTFITSRVTEQSLTSKYDSFKVRWGIDSPDFHHSLAMPFDPKLCQASLKK